MLLSDSALVFAGFVYLLSTIILGLIPYIEWRKAHQGRTMNGDITDIADDCSNSEDDDKADKGKYV